MKTFLSHTLAAIAAAAIPAFAFAQAQAPSSSSSESLPAGFVEVSDNVTSPNLRLHTVQKKQYADGGKHEVVFYPGIAQLNSKFTTHVGLGAQYLYHLHENFALQAMGQYFWLNQQVGFTDELIGTSKQQPQAATALTMQWAATGGFEVAPIYGKFSYYEGAMGHFSLVLSGGAGIGGTRIQLTGAPDRAFGDTGIKFVGQVGAGFRVRLNEDLLIRLEFRDLVYTAKVDSINGCSRSDLNALSEGTGTLSGSCQVEKFTSDAQRSIARSLVEEPSSDVLNNLGIYAGVSYTF